ncbi:MAG: response regulator [Gemmatimonadetes bacterium]|nr:MAG: response regulator [Gemmatimonadota bacterium]
MDTTAMTSLLAQAAMALLLAACLFGVARAYGRFYLGCWAAAWAAAALGRLGGALALSQVATGTPDTLLRHVGSFVAVAGGLEHAVLLMAGAAVLSGVEVPRGRGLAAIVVAPILVGALLVQATAGAAPEVRALWRVTLGYAVMGAAFAYAAFAIWRSAVARGWLGHRSVVVAHALVAAQQVHYMVRYWVPTPGDLRVLDFLDLVLLFGLGVFLVLWLLEEESARAHEVSRRLDAVGAESADRQAFLALLQRLSAEFIDVSLHDFDAALDRALGALGEALGAERSYLSVFSPDHTFFSNQREWFAAGLTSKHDDFQNVPCDRFRWFTGELLAGRTVIVLRLDVLGEQARAEREYMEEAGVRAMAAAPLICEGEVVGFVGFDVAHESGFADDFDARLRLVAQLFGSAWARRRAEAERQRLVRTLEASLDCVVLARPDGRVTYLNAVGRRLVGLEEDAPLEGLFVSDLHPPEYRDEIFEDVLPTIVRTGRWMGEIALQGPDGEVIPALTSAVAHPAPDGSVEYLSFVARDIRERKNLEGQLRQSQKMEAIGQLASGVAHDFNNLLTVVGGQAEVLLDRDDLPSDVAAGLRELVDVQERGAKLTRQLLTFAREQDSTPEALDLGDLVEGYRGFLQRLLGAHVDLRVYLADRRTPLFADSGQIEQVILNLVANARDATREGGVIEIETDTVHFDTATRVGHTVVPEGEWTVLRVRDDGVGMEPEVVERIFDPFFSTKPRGEGTGLGLSTAYGIVQQAGGHIAVESTPGRGTTMHVFLPVRAARTSAGRPPAAQVQAPGTGTILLVDDEEGVRAFVRRRLERWGYRVLEAGDAEGALEVVRGTDEAIDLLFTDLVMPGMKGHELWERFKVERPGAAVLFMSGYTGEALGPHRDLDPSLVVLRKPFTAQELAEAIDAALGRRASGEVAG